MVTPAPTSAIQEGPQPQIQPQGNQTVKAQQPDSFVGGLKGIKEPIYLPMELKGRRYMCLLDSGCDHTLVPQSLVERLRNLSVRPTNRRLRSVQDIELDIIGKVTLPMELGGRTIPTEALVSPDVQEFLLGNDWLTEHQCLWDFAKGRVYIDGNPPVSLVRQTDFKVRRVYLEETVTLPPQREADVVARTTVAWGAGSHDYMIDTHRIRPGLYVRRTLLPPTHRDLRVRMLNTSKETQELLTGTCLGELCRVEVVSSFEETVTATDNTGPIAQAIKVAAAAVDATATATTPTSE